MTKPLRSPLPHGFSALRSRRPGPCAAQAGFTLVELMVAMTGGLFLSIVVFALSRDATRFYQSETRAANATLSGVTGFDRLSTDIARAGHLVTPNVDVDPRVCNRPAVTWPVLVQQLRAITINTTATPGLTGSEVEAAGITPMSIVIAGALDAPEELSINHLGPDNTGAVAVTVREDSPAAARLGILPGVANAAKNLAILQATFMGNGVGRAVRVTQLDGMEQYGVVAGVQSNPVLQVTLATQPALVFRSSAVGALQCGFLGFNTGASINVVNFVHYELRRMKVDADPSYASLFAASDSAGLPYEAGRVELIREELSPAGAPIAGTREIVSEYAVDLQFSLLEATAPNNPALIAAAPAAVNGAYNTTQLLRAVHARLSVRSREADRQAPVSGMPAGDLYRIGLGSGGTAANAPYARVRTLQADIPLRNLQGANW